MNGGEGEGQGDQIDCTPPRKNYPQKSFLGLRYLNFCPDFFGHEGKQLDVLNWEANNYKTHIAQYLKK